MLIDSLKTPFQWFEDPTQLQANRPECGGQRYQLITPSDRVLPFLIRFRQDSSNHLPATFRIYNADTGDLVEDIAPGSLIEYYKLGQYDYLCYKHQSLGIDLPTGFYQAVIELADGYKTFYSEMFWVDCVEEGRVLVGNEFTDSFAEDFGPLDNISGSLPKYTKLEWWNDCDIERIIYQTGYHNILYFASQPLQGESEITEEGFEDGRKDFIATFSKYRDKYNINDWLPEHVITALLPVKIHKYALITTKSDLYLSIAKNFQTQFNFNKSGCFAEATCTFEPETRLLRSNCCTNNIIEVVIGTDPGGGGGEECVPVEVVTMDGGVTPDAVAGEPYEYDHPIGTGTPPFGIVNNVLPDWMSTSIVQVGDDYFVRFSGTPPVEDADTDVTININVTNCDGEEGTQIGTDIHIDPVPDEGKNVFIVNDTGNTIELRNSNGYLHTFSPNGVFPMAAGTFLIETMIGTFSLNALSSMPSSVEETFPAVSQGDTINLADLSVTNYLWFNPA